MPFISTEEVKVKRMLIRKIFPEYKISVRCRHYSQIVVIIQSGPLDLLNGLQDGYETVNHFYIKEHYKSSPEKCELLSKIYEIINSNNGEEVYDGDYGSVPNFYTSISIGDWETPYSKTLK